MQKTNYFQGFNRLVKGEYIITNLLNRAKIKNLDVIVKSKIFLPHFIKDGETPESIAESYYGSTVYLWIVCFANNIKNIYEDWPKPIDIFNDYIIKKYYSLENAQTTVHHYEDSDGDYISQSAWDGDYGKRITIYDYETKLNDDKRNITLINSLYKTQLVREFQNIFK